jgi:cell wall-associated NlpC family hydrolase
MPEGFQVRRVGNPWAKVHDQLSDAIVVWSTELDKLTEPVELYNPSSGDWSSGMTAKDAQEKTRLRLQNGPIGEKVRARGSDPDLKFAIRRTFASNGPDMIQAAYSQIGVPYVWADEDPRGGGSSGFDCSGLTKWCAEQEDVGLPHSANAQMRDPQMRLFKDSGKLKEGDFIFYNYGRLAWDQADHVGLNIDGKKTIDTRSVSEPVAVRPIDFPNVLSYGYIPAITGSH